MAPGYPGIGQLVGRLASLSEVSRFLAVLVARSLALAPRLERNQKWQARLALLDNSVLT